MNAKVSVRDLRAVFEVAEQGSFARAADALWVSRARMSEQIRSVETLLGVRLFDRTTRSVTVTPAGRVFVDYAIRLLADLSSMEEAVREVGQQPRGKVRLGLPAGVVNQRFWQVLSAFRRAYPSIDFIFAETIIPELVRSVQTGELDLSVIAWSAGDVPSGVETAALAASNTTVVVAPEHELAKQPEVTVEELAGEALVTFVPGFALRAIAEDFCRRAGLAPLIAMQSSVDETVSGLVRAKVGYSITTMDRAIQDGLAPLTMPVIPTDRVLGLAWSSQNEMSPAARKLRTRVIQSFRE